MPEGSFALALLGLAQTLRISAPTVVEALLGRVRRNVCDDRLSWWAGQLQREAAIDLRVVGREHVTSGEQFVVMSNHQSLYDIPMLFAAFPATIRMVAKKELFRIPVFGQALRASEFVALDRGNRESARESLRVARDRIRGGINVWIAPEGTRILPVTIDGTRDVLEAKGAFVKRGQRVVITFHAPIDPATYGMERRAELVAEVRRAIESALPEALRGGDEGREEGA